MTNLSILLQIVPNCPWWESKIKDFSHCLVNIRLSACEFSLRILRYTPRKKFSKINGELSRWFYWYIQFPICQTISSLSLSEAIKLREDAESLDCLDWAVVRISSAKAKTTVFHWHYSTFTKIMPKISPNYNSYSQD